MAEESPNAGNETKKLELPDAKGEIEELEKKEGFEKLKGPLGITGLIAAFLCIGALMIVGGYLFLVKNPPAVTGGLPGKPPTYTPTATPVTPAQPPTDTPTSTPVTPAQPPTNTPTSTPVTPTQPPTNTPTVELVTPTQPPTYTPIATPTMLGRPSAGAYTVAGATVSPNPQGTEPPRLSIDIASLPGKIAAAAFDAKTKTYNLYIASAPNWQPAPFQVAASQPTFSPDGTQIIFRSWGGPGTSYGEQLILRSVAGSHDQQITDHVEDASPHWASPERPVVFHSRLSGSGARVYLQGVWDNALNDPKSRSELNPGANPTWLSDGRIVYASGHPDGIGLYVMDEKGNGVRKVWTPESEIMVAPKAAPDGNKVVFSYQDDLYLLDVDGGESGPQPLLKAPECERLPVWSPDGQFIAYAGGQGDRWAVYVVRADGTGQTKLFDLPGSIDGRPSNVPDERAFGWSEEQLAWGR